MELDKIKKAIEGTQKFNTREELVTAVGVLIDLAETVVSAMEGLEEFLNDAQAEGKEEVQYSSILSRKYLAKAIRTKVLGDGE